MSSEVYRFMFGQEVAVEEVEETLLLAVLATEALHGESQARLDIAHAFDADRRCCAIDATTAVGRDLNRLFAGFLVREFGADSFSVERVSGAAAPAACAVG